MGKKTKGSIEPMRKKVDCLAICSYSGNGKCPREFHYNGGSSWLMVESDLSCAVTFSLEKVIDETMFELDLKSLGIDLGDKVWHVKLNGDGNVFIRSLNLETGAVGDYFVTKRLFRRMVKEALKGEWSDFILDILNMPR